jgi:transposase-like protein
MRQKKGLPTFLHGSAFAFFRSMDLGIPARLPRKCYYDDCQTNKTHNSTPSTNHIVRKGFYYRHSDARRIPRFLCRSCDRSFSSASFSPCFGQKRRKLNAQVFKLLASNVPKRRIARLLGTTRRTVSRKFLFLGARSANRNRQFIDSFKPNDPRLIHLQFDEMETFERSKCLPVSIPLVIVPGTRKIFGIRACSMPAKGLLAEISRKKYGPRVDARAATARELFRSIAHVVPRNVSITSDENPKYPSWIRRVFPAATHATTKGRRGCIVGYGELKAGGFDPLFALNHTAAMIRANVSRMARRTWCTTKRIDYLQMHLNIYMEYHNTVLT